MNAERWQQARALFERALAENEGERERYVRSVCPADDELRALVLRWLRADEAAGDFMDEPLVDPSARMVVEAEIPERLGPYRLLELVGHGGMGVVYRARREDGVFERDVAIKILSIGGLSTTGEARFRFERQALATLDHPWIARVYDGGTTPTGLPYLVIEFVDGLPIDAYCEAQGLDVDARIALFRKVCAAVQVSHQNLIVHCDLKPSNILVTADGAPKLLDFGIAKLLEPDGSGTDREPVTRSPRPLTPQYASPEQLRGEVISTATDVYALGVLLYKLLTGRRPHDLDDVSAREAAQLLTRAPTRPSQAVVQRPEAPRRRRLEGDLDAIVLKALRTRPEGRYASVEAFDADLGRHVDGFPVRARRGRWRYRAGRYVRRHRLLATAAAVTTLSIAAWITTATRSANQLAREQSKTQAVLDFTLDTFRVAGPIGEYPQLTLREAVDRRADLIDESFRDQPDLRASVLSVLSDIYLDFGDAERALALADEARALHASLQGESSVEHLLALNTIGAAQRELDDLDTATSTIESVLAQVRAAPSPDPTLLVRVLNNLVTTYCYQYRYDDAEAPSAEALQLAEEHLGPWALETAAATVQRAVVMRGTERPAEAEAAYRQGIERYRRVHGMDHPYHATLLNNLAVLERDRGDDEAAEKSFRAADAAYVAAFGERYAERVRPLLGLATVAKAREKIEEADDWYRQAVQVAVDAEAPVIYPLQAATDFMTTLLAEERCSEGEDVVRRVLERTREAATERLPYPRLERLLGECLASQGRNAQARSVLKRSLDGLRRLAASDEEIAAVEARLNLLDS